MGGDGRVGSGQTHIRSGNVVQFAARSQLFGLETIRGSEPTNRVQFKFGINDHQ